MVQYKICVLGAYAVGKSSLIARFARGIFSDRYLATLGVKIDRKIVKFRGQDVKLILWDMAGEDEFAKVNVSYLRGASGYLLAIDGTRHFTLEQAYVLERRVRGSMGSVPFVVLLNKCDMEDSLEVQGPDIRQLMAAGWVVCKTSARTGVGVEACFETLVSRIVDSQSALGVSHNEVKP